MKCHYCNKTKELPSFWIGKAPSLERNGMDDNWTLHEGTGKYSCNTLECRIRGEKEAEILIRKMVKK